MFSSIYHDRRSCYSKGASIITKMESRLFLVTIVFVQMQMLTFAFNNIATIATPKHHVDNMFSNDQGDATTCIQSQKRPFLFPFLRSSSQKDDGDQESLDQIRDSFFTPPQGPEPSQMPQFITDYLLKQRQKAIDDESLSTASNSATLDQEESNASSATTTSYLIAIPMEDAHDLVLELESVQRAILYHCPVLVHACLVPAQMRLPLLYVHTKSSSPATAARDLRQLTRMVQNIVQDDIFSTSSNNSVDDGHKHDDDEQGAASRSSIDNNNLSYLYREVNTDGIRPVVMTFETLQTSGPNHQVLYTVGKVAEESDTLRLSRLVSKLQQAVESVGWTTSLSSPYEQQQLEDSPQQRQDDDTIAEAFQARVPFMRLPFNFEELLEPVEEDRLWRTSEQGGNGISPIFWCQWWDDVFARDVRLRQIGIYPQQPVQQQTQQQPLSSNAQNEQQQQQEPSTLQPYQQSPEDEFHIPYELIPLPSGNAALALKERQEQAQQQERLLQQFENLQNKRKNPDVSKSEEDEVDTSQQDDQLLAKTQVRLESLYKQSDSLQLTNATMSTQIVDVDVGEENCASPIARDEESITTTATSSSTPKAFSSSQDTSSEAMVDDWTQERIRQVIEARRRNKVIFQQQEQANAASKRKNLPPIEENAVFLKYKNGSLVSEDSPYASPLQQQKQQQQQQRTILLPPYPSREYFIGIWRAVTPPTGFPEETGEATKSDNLILRVDGTTAGGPTLDEEKQQKAAGGTWRLLLNNDNDNDSSGNEHNNGDGSSTTSTVRLRIRLVIPPKKERILVMEGDVTRICMTPSDLPLTSSTFAIPELEERLEKSKEQLDDMLHCGGEVWIEDANTGKK